MRSGPDAAQEHPGKRGTRRQAELLRVVSAAPPAPVRIRLRTESWSTKQVQFSVHRPFMALRTSRGYRVRLTSIQSVPGQVLNLCSVLSEVTHRLQKHRFVSLWATHRRLERRLLLTPTELLK